MRVPSQNCQQEWVFFLSSRCKEKFDFIFISIKSGAKGFNSLVLILFPSGVYCAPLNGGAMDKSGGAPQGETIQMPTWQHPS